MWVTRIIHKYCSTLSIIKGISLFINVWGIFLFIPSLTSSLEFSLSKVSDFMGLCGFSIRSRLPLYHSSRLILGFLCSKLLVGYITDCNVVVIYGPICFLLFHLLPMNMKNWSCWGWSLNRQGARTGIWLGITKVPGPTKSLHINWPLSLAKQGDMRLCVCLSWMKCLIYDLERTNHWLPLLFQSKRRDVLPWMMIRLVSGGDIVYLLILKSWK